MTLLKEQLALYTVNNEISQLDSLDRYIFQNEEINICIKQEDCLSFLHSLPDQSVDVIVTDPAYSGMNKKLKLGNGRIVGRYNEKGTINGKWFEEFEDSKENYDYFLTECKRVLRKEIGHIYIMFDSFSLLSLGPQVRLHFDVKNLITWDKVNMGMGHYFRRRHEYIIFATNGNNRKIRNRSFPDVWRFKRVYNAQYVTQKPVELFQAMIYASAQEGSIICDPFMGSGSSAIAAIINNCNFLGCDTSQKAIDLSKKRIDHYIKYKFDLLQKKDSSLPDDKIFWKKN